MIFLICLLNEEDYKQKKYLIKKDGVSWVNGKI